MGAEHVGIGCRRRLFAPDAELERHIALARQAHKHRGAVGRKWQLPEDAVLSGLGKRGDGGTLGCAIGLREELLDLVSEEHRLLRPEELACLLVCHDDPAHAIEGDDRIGRKLQDRAQGLRNRGCSQPVQGNLLLCHGAPLFCLPPLYPRGQDAHAACGSCLRKKGAPKGSLCKFWCRRRDLNPHNLLVSY